MNLNKFINLKNQLYSFSKYNTSTQFTTFIMKFTAHRLILLIMFVAFVQVIIDSSLFSFWNSIPDHEASDCVRDCKAIKKSQNVMCIASLCISAVFLICLYLLYKRSRPGSNVGFRFHLMLAATITLLLSPLLYGFSLNSCSDELCSKQQVRKVAITQLSFACLTAMFGIMYFIMHNPDATNSNFNYARVAPSSSQSL